MLFIPRRGIQSPHNHEAETTTTTTTTTAKHPETK